MVTVKVWAGIIDNDEFILLSSMIFETTLKTQTGFSIRFVPVRVAHAVEFEPIETYDGSRIRILPLELKGSFIVIENVYDVILLTTSVPLEVNDPAKVVETEVKA